jgi:heme/copper-type cytochrome/quinol oxidase subunit 2
MDHFKAYFKNLISNSPLITIPIVTCFGYLFAYQYEIGSAIYYNIPEYLVQLNLLQVIFYAMVICIVIFTFGLFIYLFVSKLRSLLRPNPNQANRTKNDIFTSWILGVIVVLLLLVIIPGLVGEHIAGQKKLYIMIQKNDKQYAIVKIYGDSVIALAFDEKSGVLKRDILILPKDQPIKGTVKHFEHIKVER